MEEITNILMVHSNKKDVTLITSVSVFGHEFTRQYPLDFVLCRRNDNEIVAYLEVRKNGYVLHDKEPVSNKMGGYESSGVTSELKLYQNIDPFLPVGIYPLKKAKKSGE